MHFSRNDIDQLDHIYKINLINSISGYKPANLIATKSKSELTNVAVFSSVVHYGSAPPILGFVLRPTTVRRHTFDNIIETGYYTINHINEAIVEDAHHTSAKYPKDVSEFDKTKLDEEYKNNFHAPFVKQSLIKMGMKFLQKINIEANGTILILGEITDLYINDSLIENDGFVDLMKAKTAVINGLDTYATPTKSKKLTYQRPK
ncbi:flavin reductase family protein [Algibacter miyuki]|uniref:Flavin reductase family protein n=1 Tax=Algibacter miyuki TaxID=1306933 RepID=A0ABV5GXH4_9FLAO|nr:flavin reductase [Algibacter miyuki]MDN3666106.1 flavin reductase [Algibacter miyuki]